jgi:hypothetical protein
MRIIIFQQVHPVTTSLCLAVVYAPSLVHWLIPITWGGAGLRQHNRSPVERGDDLVIDAFTSPDLLLSHIMTPLERGMAGLEMPVQNRLLSCRISRRIGPPSW